MLRGLQQRADATENVQDLGQRVVREILLQLTPRRLASEEIAVSRLYADEFAWIDRVLNGAGCFEGPAATFVRRFGASHRRRR
jgi:hypothetical protein